MSKMREKMLEEALVKALRVLEGLDQDGRHDVPGDDDNDQVEVEELVPEIRAILAKE